MDKKYFYNLNALRGIAALLVVLLHYHFFLGNILTSTATGILDKLYLMVDLFFILSGFIICYVYSDKFRDSIKPKNYKKFLIARVARIYPLHVLTLLAEFMIFLFILSIGKFSLLPEWHQHLYRLDAIPVQLLFLQTVGIFDFDTWNAPAWSLSAEWWAYVIFPFLFIPISKIRLKLIPVFSILIIALWLLIEFVLSPRQPFLDRPLDPNHFSLDVNWHYGTIRGITGFIAGMLVWRIYKLLGKRIIKFQYNDSFLVITVVLCLLSMHLKWYDTFTVSLLAVIILISAFGGKGMDKFYRLRVFQKLGDWSFSIYIWHVVLINLITSLYLIGRIEPIQRLLRPFNDFELFKYIFLILFMAIVCMIGAFSYRFIEKPTRQWIRNRS